MGRQYSARARKQHQTKMARQLQIWASHSGPVTRSQLTARHSMGLCYWCGQGIPEGAPIALYVESADSKWWGHSVCVQAAKGDPM